jgi:hypothetical protein
MEATPLPTTEQPAKSTPLLGRDEMNLAEFPISLLADRAPKGQKTLYFEDQHGRLTVTGSDAYGLPTATDTDVIIALLYLTKTRNAFTTDPINFSRYEIIQLLNWSDEAWYYKRLWTSFKRWSGVLLVYDKCWWNNKLKCHTDATMHIIEDVEMINRNARKMTRLSGQDELPLSSFKWNKKFIDSCQADNLRQLNLDEYFSLESAISKRLYRFLGKRFHKTPDWTFDLNEIAFERIGLSRNYADAYKIKEKLQPALEELEAIGFLRPLNQSDRYNRIDRGQWTIRLVRGSNRRVVMPFRKLDDIKGQSATPECAAADSPLVQQLTSRGMIDSVARKLVAEHDSAHIERQIDAFDWRVETENKYVQTNPPGFLKRAIESSYSIPKGFISRADRDRQAAAKRQAEEQAAAAGRRSREQDAHTAEVEAHIKGLNPVDRMAMEAEVLAKASPEARENYDSRGMARFRSTLMLAMLREHVGRLLASRKEAADA